MLPIKRRTEWYRPDPSILRAILYRALLRRRAFRPKEGGSPPLVRLLLRVLCGPPLAESLLMSFLWIVAVRRGPLDGALPGRVGDWAATSDSAFERSDGPK
jgi:hypothetical protein